LLTFRLDKRTQEFVSRLPVTFPLRTTKGRIGRSGPQALGFESFPIRGFRLRCHRPDDGYDAGDGAAHQVLRRVLPDGARPAVR